MPSCQMSVSTPSHVHSFFVRVSPHHLMLLPLLLPLLLLLQQGCHA
jgi:hypothetical protein